MKMFNVLNMRFRCHEEKIFSKVVVNNRTNILALH